jgi:hypothetical protein
MVNLPPDQNERRDRDQILSFDELLAIVLALLGIGTILWWSTSKDRNWLEQGTLFSETTQPFISDAEGDRLEADVEESESFFAPLAIGNDVNREAASVSPTAAERAEGLPSLAGSSYERSELRSDPGIAAVPAATELEPTDLEPSTVAPEPLAEEITDASATPPPLDISDVPEGHWAFPFIQDMYDQGYLPDFPSGQFEPDKQLTRAELAALLNKSFVSDPIERQPINFNDISSDYWAADAIDQVVERGFMSGYPDNVFQPDQPVPRYQVLVSLASGLNLESPDDVDQLLQRLGNLEALPAWARDPVAAAAQQGLVVNYPEPDQLRPNETATRAEIVAMMHQALVAEGKLDPIQSEYIVAPQ